MMVSRQQRYATIGAVGENIVQFLNRGNDPEFDISHGLLLDHVVVQTVSANNVLAMLSEQARGRSEVIQSFRSRSSIAISAFLLNKHQF